MKKQKLQSDGERGMLEMDRKPERKSNKSKTESGLQKITRDKPKEQQTNEQGKAEIGSDSGS